jgi:hypothetical protein
MRLRHGPHLVSDQVAMNSSSVGMLRILNLAAAIVLLDV